MDVLLLLSTFKHNLNCKSDFYVLVHTKEIHFFHNAGMSHYSIDTIFYNRVMLAFQSFIFYLKNCCKALFSPWN